MSMHRQKEQVKSYIPSYFVQSDFLPNSRVVEGQNPETSQLIARYEDEKRRGRVTTQKPAQFNPNRYVSYVAYENVHTDQPMDQNSFSRVVRR